ncbi:hypothetical protein ACFYR1_02180 [Streptomyces canus]|uniref:hypothetical protein n=1 Tax=Streptomyces canus TaxID=58343 RepID=UPI0036C0A645
MPTLVVVTLTSVTTPATHARGDAVRPREGALCAGIAGGPGLLGTHQLLRHGHPVGETAAPQATGHRPPTSTRPWPHSPT